MFKFGLTSVSKYHHCVKIVKVCFHGCITRCRIFHQKKKESLQRKVIFSNNGLNLYLNNVNTNFVLLLVVTGHILILQCWMSTVFIIMMQRPFATFVDVWSLCYYPAMVVYFYGLHTHSVWLRFKPKFVMNVSKSCRWSEGWMIVSVYGRHSCRDLTFQLSVSQPSSDTKQYQFIDIRKISIKMIDKSINQLIIPMPS